MPQNRFTRTATSYIRNSPADDRLRAFVLKTLVKEKVAQQVRAHSLPKRPGAAEKLAKKRTIRRIAREYANRITQQNKKHTPIPKVALAHRYRHSRVLEALWPERRDNWRPIVKRDRDKSHIITIDNFSFQDDPASVLATIVQFAKAEAESLEVSVNFNFDYCTDIAALLLLAEIWPAFSPVFRGGTMKPPVQKVIEAVGLRAPLGLNFPHLRDLQDVWAMPVQRRRPVGSSRSAARDLEPQSREEVAERICDEIDEWLFASGAECELNPAGRGHLMSLIGEILDNAERHSSIVDKDGSWTVAAFMAKRVVDEEDRFVCHLGFLSVGDTVAESLEATAPPGLRRQIDAYVDPHARSRRTRQSRDTLLTVAAIQDGVTRDPEAFDAGSGGTGFMEFVESVHTLGLSPHAGRGPKIVIVSGSSCVTLRPPYDKGHVGDSRGRQLYFNEGNTMSTPPDGEFVFDLPMKLQGTVISVAFALDPDFLRENVHGGDPSEPAHEG